MTSYKGQLGRFKVGANQVAEVRSFRFTINGATADASTIETVWDKSKVVTFNWSGQVQCFWDPADAAGQGGLEVGDEPTVFLYPIGDDAGKPYFTGAVVIESVEITNERSGLVEANVQFKGNDTMTRAIVGA